MSWGALLGIAPLLVVALGGTLLMIAEAFTKRREEGDERHSGPSSELALATAVTLFVGAVFSAGVWFVGPEKIDGAKAVAPYLIVDRFTTFVSFILCLGGGLASLLAGGYLPEHKLDRGEFARKEISMAKIAVADVLHKAVDTAIQLNGARGYSKDTILEWIYRYARQARLVDGASEVHRMVLARFYMDERNDFWSWN